MAPYLSSLDNSKSCSPVLIDVPVSSLGFAAFLQTIAESDANAAANSCATTDPYRRP